MNSEARLLQRLVGSAFTGGIYWAEGPRLALFHGPERYLLRDRGWFPEGGPAHATLRFAPGDLDRMVEGSPATTASWSLGDLDAPARKKQAFAVLALAALGWCGRWPDAVADPDHVRLVRAAHYDLRIGAMDGSFALFPPGGPLEVLVRATHSVRGTELVTMGLADRVGRPELSALVPGRAEVRSALPALRAGALWCVEHGALLPSIPLGPRTLRSMPDPRFRDGLALPNQHTWVMCVGIESG